MSKYVLFALLCMAFAGGASAHVYKSIGPDGKVTYSDYPSDKPSKSVSIIKADIVQPVAVAAKAAPTAAADISRVSFLTTPEESVELPGKPGVKVAAGATQVCNERIDVLVGSDGKVIKTLGPSKFLTAFKPK